MSDKNTGDRLGYAFKVASTGNIFATFFSSLMTLPAYLSECGIVEIVLLIIFLMFVFC